MSKLENHLIRYTKGWEKSDEQQMNVSKEQIKALFLELIGEDEKATSDDAFDTVRSARLGRNDLRAELRAKIEEL